MRRDRQCKYRLVRILALFVFSVLIISNVMAASSEPEYDLIILNGTVIDGTGASRFPADVGIKDGYIATIGRLNTVEAKGVIDATDLIVAPGFIDNHSNTESQLLINPRAESKIRQGVTTEIKGEQGVGPKVYSPEVDYLSMAGFFNLLMQKGIAVNYGSVVDQQDIRIFVLGHEDREPTEEELQLMKTMVAQAMEQGAFGLGSALIYAPGSYSSTDTIVELAKVAAKYGGVYKTHVRGEGSDKLDEGKGDNEALEIARRANIPLVLCHFKAAGEDCIEKNIMEKAIQHVNDARAEGMDITAEMYPYECGGTGITALVPSWAHEGGREKMLERLADPEIRERLKRETVEGSPGWWNLVEVSGGWKGVMLGSSPTGKNNDLVGKWFDEIATIRGVDPADACFDIILEEKGQAMIVVDINKEVEKAIVVPWMAIASDGSALAPYGPLSAGQPHPRSYGTFPRVLSWAREKNLFTLEEAVRKMTWLPAQQMGITDRGKIEVGMAADITIFDSATVKDVATYVDPHQYPEGIPYVIVNGIVVIDEGEHTGALPGKILRLTEMKR